ncbi:Gfo/Idh/MocA family oxidoreductase [Photobacterium sp. GJ3]|uniref:Gfo/Idh/MocA family oxidoreductase n=1 Tax=Photobacterium sp. GJ3 TaxID=2829502 RepID=UPI001B8C5E39|nr:Gfo/Idh/MocA family oxidoreductase [Photobacterium sp. GJ3]QUJ67309.1 Gfo/Idh/MocA family oxidoreductase [Photobacterium sp. GJ3]
MKTQADHKIILIGAGFISGVHAKAIQSLPDCQIAAIVDPNLTAATALAVQFEIPQCFSHLEEALAEITFDTAHVLTPPNTHFELVQTLLHHGKHVLVEKPLAETIAACDTLNAQAQAQGLTLAVNQNFVFHPVMDRARQFLDTNAIGPVKSVSLNYEMPLRQLDNGQFGHWMFRKPVNLLLEQAVHPLSQLLSLFGAPSGPLISRISQIKTLNAQPCILRLDAMGDLAVPFHLSFALGQSFPVWQLQITGEDGSLHLDFIRQRVILNERSRFLPALDTAVTASTMAGSLLSQGFRQLMDYAGAITGFKPSKDPFFMSMQASIRAFYQSIETKQHPIHNATFGRTLVALCHQLADKSQGAQHLQTTQAPAAKPQAMPLTDQRPYDVLVIGGTGFIGRHVVRQLLTAGYSVGIMARHLDALPDFFQHPAIQWIQGDVCDQATVDHAVSRATYVINLAHGGGSGDWQAIQHAMVDSARYVALACQSHGITRLVHLGSIASLYLGNDRTVIHNASPVDSAPHNRAHYARAKAMADQMLMHEFSTLDVVLLRPGIVVGEGGLLQHTGIGFFNNSQYFIGWNLGQNPLPFVLVQDVASATLAAMTQPDAKGKTLNLVGDVRPTAREYVAMLRKGLSRPYRYVPQLTLWLYLQELGKWAIKRMAGRHPEIPSLRDLRSRAMNARFDTSGEKRLLNWHPVNDWQVFYQQAVLVHQPPSATAIHSQADQATPAMHNALTPDSSSKKVSAL